MTTTQFYSPADQLQQESARLTPSSTSHSKKRKAEDEIGEENKHSRLYYEGEADVTKWAISPPPDIVFDQRAVSPAPTLTLNIEPQQQCEDEETTTIETPSLSQQAMQRIEMLCIAQNDFERRLFQHRRHLVYEQDKAMRQINARSLIDNAAQKEMETALQQHRADLERADRRAIEKLDELRYQQQLELQELGVPGFYPTSNISVMQTQQSTLQKLLLKSTRKKN